SLTQYGLLRADRGRLYATELAEMAVYGDEREKLKAKADACRNIELFRRYYEKYGADVRDEYVRIFLRDVAGASPREVQSAIRTITRTLSRAVEYFKQVEEMERQAEAIQPAPSPAMPAPGHATTPPAVTPAQLPEGVEMIVVSRDYGTLYVKDAVSLEVLKTLIKALEDKIGVKEKKIKVTEE
ncbi:MAG: hypothetical protein DRK00_09610, partial [Thermoprotei archaeon]